MRTKMYLSKFTEKRFLFSIGVVLASMLGPDIVSEEVLVQILNQVGELVILAAAVLGYNLSEGKADVANAISNNSTS
jgi:hypothetical protein